MRTTRKNLDFESIKLGLKALFHPIEVFRSIKSGHKLDYRVIIPFLLLAGINYAFIIILTLSKKIPSMADYPYFIIMAFLGPGIWLFGSVCLYYISRWLFRRKVDFYSVERAMFYLCMIWVVAPFFDFLHLILKVGVVPLCRGEFCSRYVGIELHFACIPAIIWLSLEIYSFFKETVKVERKQLIVAMLFSILAFPAWKLLAKTIDLTANFMSGLGALRASVWSSLTIAVVLAYIVISFILKKHILGKLRLTEALVAMLFVAGMFLVNYNLHQPISVSEQVSVDSFTLVTGSFTEYHGDYESGEVGNVAGGKAQGAYDYTKNYTGSLDLTHDPNSIEFNITEVRCIVNFTGDTQDDTAAGPPNSPRAMCMINGIDSDSSWQNALDPGNVTYTWSTPSSLGLKLSDNNVSVRLQAMILGTQQIMLTT
ncbi:hypothetical protein JXB28_01910 [Candidatus Woesearchaeota archaeon]|nr:hypothetical protein [Candidatus Woesearchaeota archaeon]